MSAGSEVNNGRQLAYAPARVGAGRVSHIDSLLGARRYSQLASALVLVSLLLLAVLPVVIHNRTEQLNSNITDVIDPARGALADIEAAISLGSASTRGFLLTGDPRYAAERARARAGRDSAQVQLLSFARRLGPAEAARAAALVDTVTLADTLVDALFAGRISRAQYIAQFEQQHIRFQDATAASARLDSTLYDLTAARLAEIRYLERTGAILTVFLVVLALAAAAVVARLGQRYRTLAIGFDARARELERVTQSRARLIRGFTHDVKNPLGAADGSLALLEGGILGQLTPKQLDSVRRGRRSIHAALDLIGHLMDLARAEAGQIEIRREPTDIGALVADVAEEFRAQAETARLTLTVDLPSDLPRIGTDPARARQILANLVSNAVKYTQGGGRVTVRAEAREGAPAHAAAASATNGEPITTATAPWVTVDVTDTGPGIKPEDQAVLFEEFTRFNPGAAHGSGIGLAISQRVARALGGEIRVQSEPGVGSTFTLWLPAVAG